MSCREYCCIAERRYGKDLSLALGGCLQLVANGGGAHIAWRTSLSGEQSECFLVVDAIDRAQRLAV